MTRQLKLGKVCQKRRHQRGVRRHSVSEDTACPKTQSVSEDTTCPNVSEDTPCPKTPRVRRHRHASEDATCPRTGPVFENTTCPKTPPVFENTTCPKTPPVSENTTCPPASEDARLDTPLGNIHSLAVQKLKACSTHAPEQQHSEQSSCRPQNCVFGIHP